MTDPYNTANSYVAPAQVARPVAPATPPDRIRGLDVSDSWKDRFRRIERAGGPDLPKFRELPFSERFGLQFNFLAFLFGPIYYVIKGLWRQAVVYLTGAVMCILVLEAMGAGNKVGRAVGYGFAAIFATRANISYYKKVVLGESPWI